MNQHQYQYFFKPLRQWVMHLLPSPGVAAVLWGLLVLILFGYCVAG